MDHVTADVATDTAVISSPSMTEHRLLLQGEGGVGKQALLVQFVENRFAFEDLRGAEDYTCQKQVAIDDEACLLKMCSPICGEWTEAGYVFRHRSQGILFTYSISSRSSFEGIAIHFENQRATNENEFAMIIVGTQCDLEEDRQVTEVEGENLAA